MSRQSAAFVSRDVPNLNREAQYDSETPVSDPGARTTSRTANIQLPSQQLDSASNSFGSSMASTTSTFIQNFQNLAGGVVNIHQYQCPVSPCSHHPTHFTRQRAATGSSVAFAAHFPSHFPLSFADITAHSSTHPPASLSADRDTAITHDSSLVFISSSVAVPDDFPSVTPPPSSAQSIEDPDHKYSVPNLTQVRRTTSIGSLFSEASSSMNTGASTPTQLQNDSDLGRSVHEEILTDLTIHSTTLTPTQPPVISMTEAATVGMPQTKPSMDLAIGNNVFGEVLATHGTRIGMAVSTPSTNAPMTMTVERNKSAVVSASDVTSVQNEDLVTNVASTDNVLVAIDMSPDLCQVPALLEIPVIAINGIPVEVESSLVNNDSVNSVAPVENDSVKSVAPVDNDEPMTGQDPVNNEVSVGDKAFISNKRVQRSKSQKVELARRITRSEVRALKAKLNVSRTTTGTTPTTNRKKVHWRDESSVEDSLFLAPPGKARKHSRHRSPSISASGAIPVRLPDQVGLVGMTVSDYRSASQGFSATGEGLGNQMSGGSSPSAAQSPTPILTTAESLTLISLKITAGPEQEMIENAFLYSDKFRRQFQRIVRVLHMGPRNGSLILLAKLQEKVNDVENHNERLVVIKIIPRRTGSVAIEYGLDHVAVDQEVSITSKLSGSLFAPVLDTFHMLGNGLYEGLSFIVTEYAHFVTLQSFIETQAERLKDYPASLSVNEGGQQRHVFPSGMALTEVLVIFQHVVSALEHMHTLGIVHGDINTDNVLVWYQPTLCGWIDETQIRVQLIDFGYSRYTSQTFRQYGTARCSPPELDRVNPLDVYSRGVDGRKADVFALGVLLFTMIDGEPPIRLVVPKVPVAPASTTSSLPAPDVTAMQYPFDEFPEPLSQACQNLLRGMLHTDPNVRYTLRRVKNDPHW
ncbi:hypothetical protein BGZ83_006394 [Gryganskiella cystojenkinii]|nr:hypothetical protein BGZ83_006394 [Gryganskiella cystojenkinii]